MAEGEKTLKTIFSDIHVHGAYNLHSDTQTTSLYPGLYWREHLTQGLSQFELTSA